ncbi:MAG: oligosaccharide flippase family protein [Cellvibrio sp.]|uniref:lipopolysaccharide biosynthesis protein n=1 Tax=Cellvibrio sp. TaxID=1965322 RepID=UPI00271D0976|nr:oligosaccharide flippase family protein [Cellvibrio sp.]
MTAFRSIGVSFLGGIWTGVLVVSTTPFFVAKLGLEGFGLIGFWQLLLFVSVIFDFGLGASLVREFARYKGNSEPAIKYHELLRTLQLIYAFAALLVGAAIYLAASWLATGWLKLAAISAEEASLLIRLMAGSIALQFITTLYSNGLLGLQKHSAMNAFQMLGNTLKYLGGAGVLIVVNSLTFFFAFQVLAALFVCWLTRRQLIGKLSETEVDRRPTIDFRHVRQLSRYSAGMFLTALCGLLLANVDRIVLSKLVPADDFGKYTLAFTAAGLLQMVILAFYRSYFPRFSELKAGGDNDGLKQSYYQGCRYVGVIIVPAAVAACVFAPELFQVWIGSHDETIITVFRLLIVGTMCSGLMWLPAALQQAVGWTRLHIALMLLALGLGMPCLILGIQAYGTVGATAVVLVHGAIEISLGLWLMNRVLFPGENLRWYGLVLIAPLAACLPVALVSAAFMPSGMDRLFSVGWVGVTGIVMLLSAITLNRHIVK